MWRLTTNRGQQVWKFLPTPDGKREQLPHYDPNGPNPNAGDKIYRELQCGPHLKEYTPSELDALVSRAQSEQGLPSDADSTAALRTLFKGMNFYQNLQMEDGHWPGDYGGPMFLMPGAVFTLYVTGCLDELLSPEHKSELIRYLWNHQSPDGGWGIHIEEPCTMFGTVLTYITLRILGVPANEPKLARAKKLILDNGGAMVLPSWGKFWLCVLGVMEWEGVNSLFPELWLLPESLPVHPSRWWCHCRMVYMPMAYIYGEKVTGKLTPLILELRAELYTVPYSQINFARHRDSMIAEERYTAQSKTLKVLNLISNLYEKIHVPFFRKRANDFLLSYIHAEDAQTKYVDIGPVNKFINMLSVWHAEGADSPKFAQHKSRVLDYFWIAEDGMKVNGYNGSQLWDTAFALQAYVESGLAPYFRSAMQKGYGYLEMSQIMEDVVDRERFYRHIQVGGWPFSTRDHGWPISDCTAEGLKATLVLHDTIVTEEKDQVIGVQRMQDAVNVLLSFQNENGGWATYENTRGPAALELINASEVFGDIMIDYSYVECSSACVQALAAFSADEHFPSHRRSEVQSSIARGLEYIRSVQRADGSWYGSWAVCFTYGTWFGVEGLRAGGVPASDPAIRRACGFLLSKQREDGGWGESYRACVTKQWQPKEDSQGVNTAWGLLALLRADYQLTDPAPVDRAAKFLMSRQLPDGEWAQEGISGVFNGNCMISYTNYRNIFPMWALGRWVQARKQA